MRKRKRIGPPHVEVGEERKHECRPGRNHLKKGRKATKRNRKSYLLPRSGPPATSGRDPKMLFASPRRRGRGTNVQKKKSFPRTKTQAHAAA